jgi:hypothetical protein
VQSTPSEKVEPTLDFRSPDCKNIKFSLSPEVVVMQRMKKIDIELRYKAEKLKLSLYHENDKDVTTHWYHMLNIVAFSKRPTTDRMPRLPKFQMQRINSVYALEIKLLKMEELAPSKSSYTGSLASADRGYNTAGSGTPGTTGHRVLSKRDSGAAFVSKRDSGAADLRWIPGLGS